MTNRLTSRRRSAALAACALAFALPPACSDEPGSKSSGGGGANSGGGEAGSVAGEPQEITTLREVAAAHYGEAELVEGGFERAHEVLTKLCASEHATPDDLVDLACAKLKLFLQDPAAQAAETPKIRELCQKALERDPKLASAHYVLGVVAFDREQDAAAAKGEFEQANRLAPDDLPTRLRLAEVLNELEERDRAIELYDSVRASGREFAGAFYMPAIYRLARVLRQRKKVDAASGVDDVKAAATLLAEHKALREAKAPDPTDDEIKLGNFGRVRPPTMRGVAGRAPANAPALRFAAHAPLFPDVKSVADACLADVNSDLFTDVLVLGAGADGKPGLWLAAQDAKGAFTTQRLATPVELPAGLTRVVALDLENKFGQCLFLQGGGHALLFAPEPAGAASWVDATAQLPPLPADVRAVAAVDFGHDGHLDFTLATADGFKLIRNDGVPRDPYTDERLGAVKLVDATALAEGIAAGGTSWVAFEDFDSDQDIDLCVGGAGATTTLYTNLRKGRFGAIGPDKSGLPKELANAPLFADLDHDGKPDAVVPGNPPQLLINRGDGGFKASAPLPELAAIWNGAAQLCDVDLNGDLDFVGLDGDGELAVRFGALTVAGPLAKTGVKVGAGGRFALDDVDGDGDFDLATWNASGAQLFCGAVPGGRSLVLDLRGVKDNRQAVGAIVELRSGNRYARRLQRGPQFVGGLGSAGKAELVRISWPNGVVQNLIDAESEVDPKKQLAPRACGSADAEVAAVVRLAVPQKEGLAGSCPFLYAWNGTTYGFVSDVLGITPLGLPMTEQMYVPPDHDELVRVMGSQLRAIDGDYRFQVTEELREVTYLDRVQLWVIDHPADVAVHPEERFCFPPFPPQNIHTVKKLLAPVSAKDQDGRDWTAELAAVDGRHAVPFTPRDSRYLGLVTNHALELALPDAVRTAKKVRLLMTGWLYWTDASVNVLAARNGSIAFEPPCFSVPDGAGGWKPCGPPVGFPAGKTKTMVIDVSELLNRDDPRLRITSSIRLYWDAIEIAVDDDDAPITVTKLEPRSARLWARGFSAPIVDARSDQPERFEWDRLECHARWNQHAGSLTRYGEVVSLLGDVDDRFALFSSGDAIDLRFDATTTPLKPGLARTYLLFFDGWAKDADPNTLTSQSVEPLPFHGMSGYPYRADEHYPADDAHLDYQLEWNTRAGRRLIAPLALPRAAVAPAGTKAPATGS